ncbi:hypothetical protein TSUD_99230 [Trifolium subterraneum]|uniref:Uncharacterized protein n=1 Tax=Trifolium subterraneum TaxID=3900 RepID=A0A2Z6P7A4_TRISU|nr:hypothetical protein TSUD_99230 [Trifolium subterraneum]
MAKNANFISEGGSSNRPPLFDGDNYYYWKDKMELFLRSQDNNMEEYDRIMECKTAKEIWETLQTHHEGTNSVKETRIDIGVRKFELFEMKEEETIYQMYGRFTSIINELNSLGNAYITHERIRKILRFLPKTLRPIVTAITVAKDLTKVSLEDLIGSLKAHESILQEDKPKKKMIALETQSGEYSQKDETLCENEESLQEDDQEELAFLSRRIQILMTRRNQLKKNFQPKKNGTKPEECLLAVKRRPWYLDSGCSRHMTGDRNSFLSFETREGGSVTFGNNEKASIKDELPPESGFVSLEKDKWIWHKRAGHVNNLGKFDSKSDKGIFLGYSLTSKAYRIYNLKTQALEESMHVKFDEFEDQPIIHATDDEEDEPVITQNHDSDENLTSQGPPKTWRIVGYHPPDQIIAIIDESWVEAMKEELQQFEKNEVWNLVPSPKDHSIIGTRWVFRNKLDENGKVVRNKASLVAQGYNQQEGIDYDETFAPIASEFEMSMMGELGFFLGLQIKQQEDGIFISQEKYVNDLLKKYKMNEAKIMSTSMHPSTSLDKDEKGKDASEKEYRGMIGSLLYLTASRPDIVFAVGLYARFQTSPKESHLIAVKRIFRYLVGTLDVELWYKKGSHFDLQAYCDADYAGNKIERKSTSGACQFLGEALVNISTTTSMARTKNAGGRKVPTIKNSFVSSSPPRSPSPPKPPTPKSSSSSSYETASESHKSLSEREATPEIQSSPIITNMQTNEENPPNSPNTVFQPSQSESPENSPIHLTQSQPQSPSPVESPQQSLNQTNVEVSPPPTSNVPSQAETPPALVKIKKSKSFDSSKIRRSSRIMSGAGKKPVVDTTVHVLDQSDSETTLLDKEIDDFELEPVTSTKSEPVKAKKTLTPKKKEVETAVKAPRTKKKINVKKSKEKLMPAPLNQPEDEEIFDKYWKTKLVAVSRMYNFAELSLGGVDLVKFVEPFEWKNLLTSNIKDVELVVDPFVIGSLIGIKSEGLEVYGNNWYDQVKINKDDLKRKMFTEEGAKKNAPPSSMLKTEYKLLHNMCQHSFFPRTGSKDKVTDLDLLLMYHMAKGIKLNLPYIILHHIIHAATSGFKKIDLPYAMILTRVFRLYYADMDNTPFENHYYTFSLKNVSHMKKESETPIADVGVKRKREVFEKTNLNVLADASGDLLENALQTDGNTQTSGDANPTTESEKLVTTAATTLQNLNVFIRNILTSDTPEISTLPIPNPTDSTLPSIPSSFATFDSFCSSVNAANAGTKQLVFEGNINFDFPGPSRPAKRSRIETNMEQMRKDLDNVIKGMTVQHSMMNHLILESKTLRDWFANVVCHQLHINPPPTVETPQFDPFLVSNDKSDDDDCPPTSPAPDGAHE